MNIMDSVSKIMTQELITLPASASIAEAANIFKEHSVHHIPITSGLKLIGMVSKSDYLFFRRGFLDNVDDEKIEAIRMNDYQVSFIMTRGIAKLEPSCRINVALELFKENIFHAIPIVEEDKLVGMVTTYDIINQLATNQGAVAQY